MAETLTIKHKERSNERANDHLAGQSRFGSENEVLCQRICGLDKDTAGKGAMGCRYYNMQL